MTKHSRTFNLLLLPFLLFILFIGTEARAATAWVQSTADSGADSLRKAITDTNSYATSTVTWASGSGGTLTLLSDLPAITSNSVWDLDGYTFTIAASTNSMSIAAALTILNDSVQSTMTINEDIGGTGSLTKTGDGLLVLTGTNTYSGGTFLNGGVLSTNWDGALGATSSSLTFNGGTLKILNNFYSTRGITLNSAGGILDTNSYYMSLSGIISGAGGLTKNGAGTLSLSGANTYFGTTTINAGTLQLGADNAIPQGSTVTLASGATLDLAGHTDTIAAYSGSGTLTMKLRTDGLPNLTVTGNASIGSSYLYATFSPQLITAGQTFIPLKADSLTGTFLSIYSPAAISFTPTYNSTSVVLTASLVPFASIAATGNQRAVGAALEPLRTTATGDLATVIGNMYVLDAAGVRSALDQIGPVSISALRGLAFSGSDLRSGALRARTADLADGAAGVFSTYSGRGSSLSYMDYDDIPHKAEKTAPKKTDAAGKNPLSFFAYVSGVSGKDMNDKGNTGERPGYKFNNGGLLTGADYSITESLAAGVMAGYGQGKADVYFPAKATLNSTSARYGAYAAASAGPLRLNLYAGRSMDSFETKREISFGVISRTAKGTPNGKETNLEADMTWQFRAATPNGRMSPFVTLNYDHLKTGSFTETGADSLNLSVRGTDAKSLRSAAGLRYCEAIQTGTYILRTGLSAAWNHEFYNQSLPIAASLTSGGGAFTVNSGDSLRDAIKTGARISAEFESNISTYLDYSGDYRRRLYSNLVTLGASLKF